MTMVCDTWEECQKYSNLAMLKRAAATQLFVYKDWMAYEHPLLGDQHPILAVSPFSDTVYVTDALDRESFEEQVDNPHG